MLSTNPECDAKKQNEPYVKMMLEFIRLFGSEEIDSMISNPQDEAETELRKAV